MSTPADGPPADAAPAAEVAGAGVEGDDRHGGHGGRVALTLGALGVVFGDIGTSPLYAMKETFAGHHTLAPDPDHVYGVISLIFWAITIIVTLKYVVLIMRADNHGEGGIMALIALVQDIGFRTPRRKFALIALGAFGASLFFGDAMITPAISVLSAVEGLELVEPSFKDFVVPVTLAILATLFAIQRFGTSLVGRLFGPVMATWFLTLGVLGLHQVVKDPSILKALSPHYGLKFLVTDGHAAFLALGSVVLAVTGAEALYADMGHFGRSPIQRAWFALVLPALVLNYMGQGVLLLDDPTAVESPLYHLVGDTLLVPLVLLATAAAVIASQAVISGAFSVARQAVQLGFAPMLTIRHTSREAGQIYLPGINWGLFAIIVALVVGFGSSSALASAYGIAVTGTLAIDTILFFVVVRMLWGRPAWLVAAGVVGFLTVDLGFFAANVSKIASGGWFPLVIAATVFTVLMTWRRGAAVVEAGRAEEEGPLLDFVVGLRDAADPPVRVPGTAIFLNADPTRTPLALRYNVEHNRVLHEQVVVVSVRTLGVPSVAEGDRVVMDDLQIPDDGVALVTLNFGFQDEPDVPAALRQATCDGQPIDVDGATYFLSRVTIGVTRDGAMAPWRKRLFAALERNAAGRVHHFGLPDERVVSFGSQLGV